MLTSVELAPEDGKIPHRRRFHGRVAHQNLDGLARPRWVDELRIVVLNRNIHGQKWIVKAAVLAHSTDAAERDAGRLAPHRLQHLIPVVEVVADRVMLFIHEARCGGLGDTRVVRA